MTQLCVLCGRSLFNNKNSSTYASNYACLQSSDHKTGRASIKSYETVLYQNGNHQHSVLKIRKREIDYSSNVFFFDALLFYVIVIKLSNRINYT